MNERVKKATNISCVGDDAFKETLRLLGMKHNKNYGVLVRQAIDAVYGDELNELRDFFLPRLESKLSNGKK